ncbi:MAG: Cj0069 family protein [Magnetococcales bacterium]|nr:Cj0069 family protein [Magnetococcales bacterium]
MKKKVIFFEAEGGSDKGPDGYRADTMPMVESLRKRGWDAEVIFYAPQNREKIYKHVVKSADAYVPRVNPGNLEDEGEFFDFLRQLTRNGVRGLPAPETMQGYGAKDALVKLRDTDLVPDDVYAYYEIDKFKKNFPKQLLRGERVLKQNRGSTGEGIWRVELLNGDGSVPRGKAMLKCTEAVDNHVEERRLDEFMTFCEQYIVGDNGMLIDMPFLPRIKEGEVRVFMLYDKPFSVVHKKPAEDADAFSATLFSGAKYRYDAPEDWPDVVELLDGSMKKIVKKLGKHPLPLIWTADFILDTDKKGRDIYVLGEMNASCVGFTSNLGLSEDVADVIIGLLTGKE